MRQQVLCILLSTIVLYTVTKDMWTIAFFKANQTYIAEAFCINKNDSQSCCKGKCYLKKKLKENRGDEKIPALEMTSQKVYFIAHAIPFELKLPELLTDIYFSSPKANGRSHLNSLFRPPYLPFI